MYSCARMLRQGLRHRRIGVPALILFMLLSLGSWPLGRQVWATYHFRAARRSLEQRDYLTAEAHLQACLAVWNDDEATHLLAARCARCQQRYAEAQRHLARCRRAAGAPLENVLLSVQRGQLGENENYLKRTIHPDHPDAAFVLEALALGYSQTDRLASLLECTDLWLQIRPEDPQALYWGGYAWERLRHGDRARDYYQRALAADPVHDKARLRLGNLLLQRFRQPAQALEQFEELRPRHREEPEVLLGLVRCYRLLGRLDEAQQLIQGLLANHSQLAEALAEHGRLALACGQLSEGERCFRQVMAVAPDDRETLYNLLQCLERRGQEEEAHNCALRLKQLERDLACLEELVAEIGLKPDDTNLRCQAGRLCLRYGKDQEALHWLNSALQVERHQPAVHAALADYYQRHGQTDLSALHRRLAAKP